MRSYLGVFVENCGLPCHFAIMPLQQAVWGACDSECKHSLLSLEGSV